MDGPRNTPRTPLARLRTSSVLCSTPPPPHPLLRATARQTHRTPLPEIEGDFNFVNSQGLAYEASEITRCLRSGLLEAPAFDSEACLRVMQVITDIRAHWLPPAAVAS